MRSYVILGLGKSGLAALRYLVRNKACVKAWDDSPTKRAEAGKYHDFIVHDPRDIQWATITHLVLSPGIPHTWPTPHPEVLKAKFAGVHIISDVELYALDNNTDHPITIGVTGTNGKSTTCALTANVLSKHKPTFLGGNFGASALDILNTSYDYAVLELSSFQIDITHKPFLDVAALLNITPDHINRHGSFSGYVVAKMKLFSLLKPGGIALISIDSKECRDIYNAVRTRNDITVHSVSVKNRDANIFQLSASKVSIRGKIYALPEVAANDIHPQNTLFSIAMVDLLKIPSNTIFNGLSTFVPLAHRQELVVQKGNIHFVNDSKATNVDAANGSLTSYKNIFWLAGGILKENPVNLITDHIKKAYLFGEGSSAIAKILSERNIPFIEFASMTDAIDQAITDAEQEDSNNYVLLAPACASYDQFKDYEERGNIFKQIVQDYINRATKQ